MFFKPNRIIKQNSIRVANKKTKEYNKDIFGVSYEIYIQNNVLEVKLNVENGKNLLFEYRLYDIDLLIGKTTYSKNKIVKFNLKTFGRLKIRVFVKKEGSKKPDYSFLTEDIYYDADTAYKYLNNNASDYNKALLQIADNVNAKKIHTKAMDGVMEKLYAIVSLGYNISEYFREQGINKVSIFGYQDEIKLSKFIWINLKYASHFHVKYCLSNGNHAYSVSIPRKINLEYKKLDETFAFKKNDAILVCSSTKDEKLIEELKGKTSVKIVHILDIIRVVYPAKFFVEPLIKVKIKNPHISIIVFAHPVAEIVKNQSKNESDIVGKALDIKDVRKNINLNVPVIPLSLSRFGNSVEYNQEILRPFYLTKDENGIQYPANYQGTNVNVVDGFRLTTDQPKKYENTVYIFGNHTVYGLCSSDENTIPSNLQRLLNGHFGAQRAYRVVNCANHIGVDFEHQINLIKHINFKNRDIIISTVGRSAIDTAKKHFIVCYPQSAFERPHDMGEVFINDSNINQVGNQKVAELLFQTMLDNKLFDEKAEIGKE